MLFWTPHYSDLDSAFFVLDSKFWLDSTLKIDPALVYLCQLKHAALIARSCSRTDYDDDDDDDVSDSPKLKDIDQIAKFRSKSKFQDSKNTLVHHRHYYRHHYSGHSHSAWYSR